LTDKTTCANLQRKIRSLEKKTAEHEMTKRKLAQSQDELSAIYDHTLVMMCVLGRDRRVLYANRGLTTFTGIAEKKLVGGTACGVFGCINALDDPRGCGFGPSCKACDLRAALDDSLESGTEYRDVAYDATFLNNGDRKRVSLLGSIARIDKNGDLRVLLCLNDIIESKRVKDETAAIAEIGRIIGSTLDIDEVYERFAVETRKLIPSDRVVININKMDTYQRYVAYVTGVEVPGKGKGDLLSLPRSINETLIRTRKGMILHLRSAEQIEAVYPSLVDTFKRGLRSLLSVPLISRDEVIGTLHFRARQPNLYTDHHLRLAERVGMQIAGAIANAQLFNDLFVQRQALQRIAQQQAALAAISRVISATVEFDQVFERFAEITRKLIPFDMLSVNLVDISRSTVRIANFTGMDLPGRTGNIEIPLGGTMTGHVLRTGKAAIIKASDQENLRRLYPAITDFASIRAGFLSNMLIPLFSGENAIGVLHFRARQNDAYGSSDLELAERVGMQIVGVFSNAKIYEEQKRAEKAMIEAEEKYRSIFENAQEAIFRSTIEGKIILANPAMARMLGYDSPDELIEDTADISYRFVDPEEPKTIQRMLAGQGTVTRYETQRARRDGKRFWVSMTMKAIRNAEGKTLYCEGIEEDITERKLSIERLRRALGATVQAMALAVETRDPYTAGHQRRVSDLVRSVAAVMALSSERIDGLRMASAIHDLGKISVPSEILSKPTRLTDIEFMLIKNHSQAGYDILKDIEFPWPIARIVLEHHERINGSGYPNGLSGENLLLESRTLAVADVVESMASHRPYRPALGIDAALEEITCNRRILYDSEVVDACLHLFMKQGYRFPA
jgi:PAS domain S-box-containing protein